MTETTVTIYVGPGMRLDGGPFGGTVVTDVSPDGDTVELSHGGSDETGPMNRERFDEYVRDLLGDSGGSLSPVSKGDGVYPLDVDIAGTVLRVEQYDRTTPKTYDADDALRERAKTLQREFDRGRVTIDTL